MDRNDYGKYFITETPRHPEHPQSRERDSDIPWCDSLYIDNELGWDPSGRLLPRDLHGATDGLGRPPQGVTHPRLSTSTWCSWAPTRTTTWTSGEK